VCGYLASNNRLRRQNLLFRLLIDSLSTAVNYLMNAASGPEFFDNSGRMRFDRFFSGASSKRTNRLRPCSAEADCPQSVSDGWFSARPLLDRGSIGAEVAAESTPDLSAVLARLWPFMRRGRGHRPRARINGSGVLFGRVGAVMLPKSPRARSRSARRPGHRRRSDAVRIPRGGRDASPLASREPFGQQRDDREQGEQAGRGAGDRHVGPLPPLLDAQIGERFLESDLDGPAPYEEVGGDRFGASTPCLRLG